MFRKLLLAALCLIPTAAHAEWVEASSAHFRVYSNDRPERVRAFATQLEQFDKALRVRFHFDDTARGAAGQVTVYVVSTVDQVQRLARDKGAAGFYSGRAGASVAFVPRSSGAGEETDLSSQAILLHEYTHHFMLSNVAGTVFPPWFVEGFAEAYATAQFEKGGSVVFGNPPQYRAYGLLNESIPIEKLLTVDPNKLPDQERDTFYGRAWLLTHYLTFGGKREGQFSNYVNAINAGKPPLDAARAAFGDLKALNGELNHYVEGRFSGLRVPAATLTIGPVAVRTLGPGEAAIMPIRIRSQSGVDEKTAPDVYRDAQKIAAAWPSDAAVQDALAEAAFDAADYAASEAAADRAIAADPKRVRPWLYKANAQIRIALAAKDHKPATWIAIRKVINSGNRLDSEDPRPLALFYQSFVLQGVAPTKNANDALRYAYLLAPQDEGLRMTAGALFLHDGKAEEARQAFAPVAYDPHGGALAKFAAELVALIDKGDLSGALARLDGASDQKPDKADSPDKISARVAA